MSEHQLEIETEINGHLGTYNVDFAVFGIDIEILQVRDRDGKELDLSFAEQTAVTSKIVPALFSGKLKTGG